jgi:hypothetical protein
MYKKCKLFTSFITLCVVLLIIAFACRKSATPVTDTVAPLTDGTVLAQKTNSNCPDTPDYGDSIIYGKWRGPHNDYTIKPKKIRADGHFFAWPQGLVLDPATGEINVTKSEAGVRYKIGFVKSGTTDTCFTTVILAGITYLDGIYSLDGSDTLAKPYYNANPAAAPVCDESDDDDYPGQGHPGGNANCEFDDDDDDDNGNGKEDEPPSGQSANAQKLKVRTKSGIINLKKSFSEGIFGVNPGNGDNKKVTIYYRLNDKGNKVLQSITVDVWFYNRPSDIPAAQQQLITNRQQEFAQFMVVDSRPRPPQIVITRYSF